MQEHFLRDLGAFMALLEDAPVQQRYPLRVLYMRLWPAMQHQHYELMWQDGHPVAYVNWAWLTLETSVTYRDTQCLLTETDWVAGDQLWFMEIIAAKENLMPFLKRLRHRFSSGIQGHWHEVRAHHAVICKSIRLP
jgi:cytolysin-activating lysine-acyltransferase